MTACAAAVIVDGLSFGKAVDVAVGRGARVFPGRCRNASAEVYARSHDALLNVSDRAPRLVATAFQAGRVDWRARMN